MTNQKLFAIIVTSFLITACNTSMHAIRNTSSATDNYYHLQTEPSDNEKKSEQIAKIWEATHDDLLEGLKSVPSDEKLIMFESENDYSKSKINH